MLPRRKRRAPTAKEQPPEPPRADAPLAEKLAHVNNQELERRITASKLLKKQRARAHGLGCNWCSRIFPHDTLELKWNDYDTCIVGDLVNDRNLRASITSLQTVGNLQFPGNSVDRNLCGCISFGFSDSAWSELPTGQMAGATDAFQAPGAVSNRLSIGMTPKTVRLPKNGEMLLSVHGSPLGVYKEENLAAIQESGNGSEDATC